jgi:thiosulfate/3-mercaptopyruvate sulfurtransferase
MSAITDRGYRHPDALVSTEWVAAHADDSAVRVIESNEDTLLYASGHVPGAVHVDWTSDLNDQIRRDYIERAGFEARMSKIGVTPHTTVV